MLLTSLEDIKNIAKQIKNGQFKLIKKLPWIKELRDTSIVMNNMSSTIESRINNLNNSVEKLTLRLSKDELTGLQIEQSFRTDMKDILGSKNQGYMFSIKIDDLAGFAKVNTSKTVDNFLKEFANILKKLDKDVVAYRFYGSTFALVAKNIDSQRFENIIINLQDEFSKLSTTFHKVNIANIGVTTFDFLSDANSVISSANEAHAMAKQIGNNEYYLNDDNHTVRDSKEWKELIFDIIDNDKFNIQFVNKTLDINDANNILMEEVFISVKDKKEDDILIGTFISLAQEYEKIIELDKKIITTVIEFIKTNNIKHEIIVNLSFDSIISQEFNTWLVKLLKSNNDISKNIVFALSAYGLAKDQENFKIFIENIHQNQAKVMIKRYETKLVSLDHLKEFKLDYIRVARDYTSDINNNTTQQRYIQSIYEISKLLDIKVIAEDVKTQEDFDYLKGVGIFGVSR